MGAVTSLVDLYDSEILRLEKVLHQLNDKQGRRVDLEAFRREIMERFASQGFGVEVKTYTTDQSGTYAFDVEIRERLGERSVLEGGQGFDHERQAWEIQHDVLDLNEGGTIPVGEFPSSEK